MRHGRLTPSQAREILHKIGNGAEAGESFHALRSDTVARIIEAANARGYRRPKNANGSRARYFYACLQRTAAREGAPARTLEEDHAHGLHPFPEDGCSDCDEEEDDEEEDEYTYNDEDADISGADLIEWLSSFHGPLWERIRRAYLHGGEI